MRTREKWWTYTFDILHEIFIFGERTAEFLLDYDNDNLPTPKNAS